jgi:hypothetical protein
MTRNLEVSSRGSINRGYKLMRLAWPQLNHQFAICQEKELVDGTIGKVPATVIMGHHRYSPKVLKKSPVDLLVIK